MTNKSANDCKKQQASAMYHITHDYVNTHCDENTKTLYTVIDEWCELLWKARAEHNHEYASRLCNDILNLIPQLDEALTKYYNNDKIPSLLDHAKKTLDTMRLKCYINGHNKSMIMQFNQTAYGLVEDKIFSMVIFSMYCIYVNMRDMKLMDEPKTTMYLQ